MGVIDRSYILLDTSFKTRDDMFRYVAQKLYDDGRITDIEKVVEGFYERERMFSTYMGNGIAIPHCKINEVKKTTVIIIRNVNSINWDGIDESVNLVFMMVVEGESANKTYLKMLSKVAQSILDSGFIEIIRNAGDADTIMTELNKLETE